LPQLFVEQVVYCNPCVSSCQVV